MAERGADRHAVFQTGVVGEIVDARLDLMLAVGVVEQCLINALDGINAWVGTIEEKLLRLGIGEVEEELAPGRLAITTGATGFLIVGLDTAGHIIVHHEAHIRSVDAHAKGIRGHSDVTLATDELVLPRFAFLVIETAVILHSLDVHVSQSRADLIHTLARGAVDDAFLVLADDLLQPCILVIGLLRVKHIQTQVRPLKSTDGDIGVTQREHLQDVRAHLGCGRGCECHDLRSAELLQRLA